MQNSEKLNLTVIIVNWNTGQLLRECLQSLTTEIKKIKNEVVIIDNCSSDESIRQAKQVFPTLHYIENSQNGGFAKANNQGLAISKGQFVLFLNPDTRVQPGSIHCLLQFMRDNPQTGVVGGKLIYPDGNPQPSHYKFPSLGTFQHLISYRYIHAYPESTAPEYNEYLLAVKYHQSHYLPEPIAVKDNIVLETNQPMEVDYPVGACFLVRRQVIDQIGFFDERFFLYCEEADFCFRVKLHGWKIFSIPQASIIHHAGASTGKVKNGRFQIWSESQIQYVHKYCGWLRALHLRFLLQKFPLVFQEAINSVSTAGDKSTLP